MASNRSLRADHHAQHRSGYTTFLPPPTERQPTSPNGTQQSAMDEYGNWVYLAPMALGGAATIFAAAWRFLGLGVPLTRQGPLDSLYALGRRIRKASTEAELSDIEEEIDDILRASRGSTAGEDETAGRPDSTQKMAAHRLESGDSRSTSDACEATGGDLRGLVESGEVRPTGLTFNPRRNSGQPKENSHETATISLYCGSFIALSTMAASAVVCAHGVYRSGCVGARGAVVVGAHRSARGPPLRRGGDVCRGGTVGLLKFAGSQRY